MHQFLHVLPQQLINGLDQGAIYALIAVGYTLVYGVLRLINFAHGDVFMVGAYLGLMASNWTEQPVARILVALLVAMGGCAILGMLIELLAYRPLRRAPRLAALITAIGLSLLLENGAQVVPFIGPDPRPFPALFGTATYTLGPMSVSIATIVVWIATAIVFAFLYVLVLKTRVGKAMRAVQHDQEAAALMGVNVNGVITFTFALGSALAAVGGVLYANKFGQIDPIMGLMPGLKAFVAAVLGGIGSIQGAILGGLVLGVVETLVSGIPGGATYSDGIAFLILIVVLLWKPTGLLGTGAVEKV